MLFTAAVAGIAWIVWQTRAALVPFFVGGAIAYILLPVVNLLDRVMPRFLAVLISLGLLLAGLALVIYAIIPPLAAQIPAFLQLLPDRTQIQQLLGQLQGTIQSLPGSTRETVLNVLQSVSVNLRQYFDQNLLALPAMVAAFLLGIFNSIGFVLGLLVIPAWLLNILKDQPKGVTTIKESLPETVQKDFWAMMKIIDRPLRDFVSGQFLIALATGVAIYLAMVGLELLGWSEIRYKMPLALWGAAFALIPEVGPYLGAIPAVIAAFLRSPAAGVEVIAVYILINYLVNWLVGSRVESRVIKMHPVLLLIGLVALSQLGILWVFIAMPVISILIGLFRYFNGRLSTPPRPAGVLPDQPIPEAAAVQPTPAPRTPLAYRRIKPGKRPSERI